jgi:hypothetical protein
MGGDDSQKLLPWRGIYSSPGRKPPAHYEINTVTETAPRFARLHARMWLSYRLPGSFLASTGGSVLARAEGQDCFHIGGDHGFVVVAEDNQRDSGVLSILLLSDTLIGSENGVERGVLSGS